MSEVAVGRERAERSQKDEPDVPGGLIGVHLGSYELVSFLGRGGMADVYTAVLHSGKTRGRVALKRMLPRLARLPRMVELFKHEARLGARLSHPNLVRCIDFDTADGIPFLVQEHVVGVPLDAALRWLAGRDGFPARLAVFVARSVLRGLAHAHEARDANGCSLGIVHQDVAPDNILLGRDGEVKLADFGVAKSTLAPDATPVRELRGKIGYMSPEQAAGLPTDARSDLFGVGVVLAELLVGRRLLAGRDELSLLIQTLEVQSDMLSELEHVTPPELANIVRRALARDPSARFENAAEFERALRGATRLLGEPASGADLVVWLAEHGLVSAKSGMRESPVRSVSGKVLAKKLAAASEPPAREEKQLPSSAPASRPGARSLPRYGVLTRDNHVIEMLPVTELLGRIATGQAELDAPLLLEGGRRALLREIPALAFTAKLPAYQFDAQERRAEWVKPLARRELASLFFRLARNSTRGLVAFRAGQRRKHVYFENGAPCFVASNDPMELLGARLVGKGLLTLDELHDIMGLACRQGIHLGAALVNARIVGAGEMLRILLSELSTRVLEIGMWPEGEVRFVRGARPGFLTPRPPGPPGALAARLARTTYCDAEIEAFLGAFDGALLAAVPDASPVFRPSPVEREVIAHASGAMNVERLVARFAAHGIEPEATRRALFVALSAGALASPAWSATGT